MNKRWIGSMMGLLLGGVVLILILDVPEKNEAQFSDGRGIRIVGVTYGTNHVFGINPWWLKPLSRILPASVLQTLTPKRLRCVHVTDRPALVIWSHELTTLDRASPGRQIKINDPQIIDENGDVYTTQSSGIRVDSNDAVGIKYTEFRVFPRRGGKLKCVFTHRDELPEKHFLWISNPAKTKEMPMPAPEGLPTRRQVGSVAFTLESLAITTNRIGPGESSQYWEPVFKLTQNGRMPVDWQPPRWEAEDRTSNRGQWLALHEPVLKFILTTRPRPEAVAAEANRWRLPFVRLSGTSPAPEWQTNGKLREVSFTVRGPYPPGVMAQVTPQSGMQTHGWTVFLCPVIRQPDQELAVGLRDEQGKTIWGQCRGSIEPDGEMLMCDFDLPIGIERVALDIALLEPVLRAEFVVDTAAELRSKR
jgi:hypothetical protein